MQGEQEPAQPKGAPTTTKIERPKTMTDYSKCKLTKKSITFNAARFFETYQGAKGNQSVYMRSVWSSLSPKYEGQISGDVMDAFKADCEAIIKKQAPSPEAQMKEKMDKMKTDMKWALKKGNLDDVKALLADGCPMRYHALAVEHGHHHIVKYLLSKGAKFSGSNLITAAHNGDSEMVNILLASGVDINAKNSDDETALHEAAGKGNVEIVKILLEHGADVNAQNYGGQTPLVYGIGRDDANTAIVKMLLEHGADVTIAQRNGMTAIDIANWRGTAAISEMIEKA